MHLSTRREFLAASAAASLTWPLAAQESKPPVAFFLIGDTHFLAEKENTSKLDARSALVTSNLIDTLNKLPGTEIPKELGGGKVLAPSGVIHAGDCIDTGDKANVKMQETEWAAFSDGFGLTGKDGRLKFPVYEVHGNHDSPRGDGLAIQKMIARTKNRPGVSNVSKNGLHYSWDWGPVHFVNLGIVVGQRADITRKRRYAPLDSLEFLVADLKEKIGTSGRPVVITHHVDVLRYSQALPVEDKKAESMEWDPADVQSFHQAIKGYSVAAVLYGHTHARNVFRWDGTNKPAKEGVPTFNVDNSSHFFSKLQGFFYFEIAGNKAIVREYVTDDSWQTGKWTNQVWS